MYFSTYYTLQYKLWYLDLHKVDNVSHLKTLICYIKNCTLQSVMIEYNMYYLLDDCCYMDKHYRVVHFENKKECLRLYFVFI